jgi:hypothetical protein
MVVLTEPRQLAFDTSAPVLDDTFTPLPFIVCCCWKQCALFAAVETYTCHIKACISLFLCHENAFL